SSPRVSPLFPYTTLFRSWGPSPRRWTPERCVACGRGRCRGGRERRGSCQGRSRDRRNLFGGREWCRCGRWHRERIARGERRGSRSEEHTSELQSRENLVC